VEVTVTFRPVTYLVTFLQGGPYSGGWAVQLGGVLKNVTAGSILFTEPNGTFAYTVGHVPGYIVNPSRGTVTVAGAGATTTITFAAGASATYWLNFTESGLPTGTPWSVTVTSVGTISSTGGTITFRGLTSATYNYSFATVDGYVTPANGSIPIVTGSVSVEVTYSPWTYPVMFAESGLPSRTPWSVTIGDVTEASVNDTIQFELPNGTFTFEVATISGSWQATTPSGNVTVNSTSVEVAVEFVYAYPISITVTGLADGTRWFVNVTGTIFGSLTPALKDTAGTGLRYTFSSTSPTLVFSLPNGTYTYTVESPDPSWTPAQSTGALSVQGQSPPPVAIAPSTSSPVTILGLSPAVFVAGVVIVALVALLIGLLIYRRSPRFPKDRA